MNKQNGWYDDILKIVQEKVYSDIFTLQDVYVYEDYLRILHPKNNNIKDKIRQELQLLRNNDVIEFLGNGTYKRIETLNSYNEYGLSSSVIEMHEEGERTAHYTTKYERNPKNREAAIHLHGCKCQVCDFDFEKTYGPAGKGLIEVHHRKPLYSLDESVLIDPEQDLVCLCANCHRMIHRYRDRVYTVDELKEMINSKPTR